MTTLNRVTDSLLSYANENMNIFNIFRRRKRPNEPNSPLFTVQTKGTQTVTFHEPVTINEVWENSEDADDFINKLK
jgi:hypothetical protein